MTNNKAKPLCLKFNIKFVNNKNYLRVFIWKNVSAMRSGSSLETDVKFYACFIGLRDAGQNCLGELHFYKDYMGAGVVSHELLHAIFDLSNKLGRNIKPPSWKQSSESPVAEYCEYLCTEMEKLSRSFWTIFHKRVKEINKL